MSAVTLLPASKEIPSEESQQNGPNQTGLDESGGGGGGDPAVLAMGPARRPLTYTRDELMKLRNSPLVKRGLENAFAGCEALALVLKKRSDSPNEDDRGARGDAPNENHKGVYGRERDRDRERERRSADPRERVRKESEPSGGGIVLSPQRRSFTSGCGAPAAAAPPPHLARTRPDSPLSQQHVPQQKTAEQAGRRIGSGRIMVRDEAGRGREEGEYRSTAEPYRPPATRGDHARSNNDRFDRRSFSRDSFSSDIKRERDDRFNNDKNHRDDNRRSGGRFSQRRFEKEDEPEWFSGGPTSQLETIELRGFDEPIKKNGSTNNSSKENDRWSGGGGGGGGGGARSPAERWRAEAEAAPQPHDDSLDTNNDKDSGVETKSEEPAVLNDHADFNLDEFLKFDTIPDVLTNGSSETEGSRFSRWFRRDSPTNDTRHYERIFNNMVDDLDKSTRIDPPPVSETSHVFAPISPVGMPMASMAGMGMPNMQSMANMQSMPAPPRQPAPPSLLDLLRRANANPDTRPANNYVPEMNSVGTKIHSLEELEARLRPQHSAPHPAAAAEADMTAFKRLMAQVTGGHAVAAEQRVPQPPLSLIQMLNKSMEAAQKPAAPHIPQDLVLKLLQVQQQQQQQQQQQRQHQQQVMGEMALGAADRELLQRPEAQAIIHGLKAGEITVQHLMQQLSNPGLQSRHRDVLHTILRLHHQRQQMGSPLPGSMGPPPQLVVPPTHQPLRISPLPSVPARIPSPRELAAHTQSIMQSALIKKKLEEQRENYRRRHEQPKQSTPISFTPTSVLRKMTAEKESEAPSPKQQQQWGPHKLPQGRPIVKGNQSGVATYTEYPQHYMNHQPQQMVGGARSFPHPQQRQQVPNNYNNMNMNNMSSMSSMGSMARGMPGGTTLHQLLVQSHQRNINEMGGNGAGGGDNQLARWFSPELLARASAGKLPSVHVPNALSLEDLERHHHSPAPPVRN